MNLACGIGCGLFCCCATCSGCIRCYECYSSGTYCCASGGCCEGCARGKKCCGEEQNESTTNGIILPNRKPEGLLQMPPTVSNNRINTIVIKPVVPVQEQ